LLDTITSSALKALGKEAEKKHQQRSAEK